ncbi:MAG: AAA family ATPase [Actinobacteria bacterium]|nr:AAA family ATPase [Actinomycetota bacterium]
MQKELSPRELKIEYDSGKLKCKTTEELTPLEGIIGQERAVKALKFGLNIKDSGFNIFVAGYSGTGRTTGVRGFVEEIAKKRPAPLDWCYINNFKNSYEPNVIKLPAGKGKIFREDISNFIISIRNLLPKTFESKDYSEKKATVIKSIEQEREKLLNELNKRAQDEGFVLRSTQIGLFIVPTIDGKILSEDEFIKLDEEKKKEIQQKKEKINDDLKKTMDSVRDLDKKTNEAVKKLNHDVALYTIEKFVNDIKEKYKEIPEVNEFIDEVREDILKNVDIFIASQQAEPTSQYIFPWMKEVPFKKYEVNLLVDNSQVKGAPVIIEKNPTYQNLFGRVEKEAQFGVLTTDFTMIRGGSLHKANNGFLVIPVEELFKNIFSWDSLKMSLTDKKIIIEEAGEKLGFITTKGLKPEPIPLNVKVILIGKPIHYTILYSVDDDFKKLFKVKADFDLVMNRNDANIKKYASFLCTICNKEKLKHLQSSAISKMIEYASRLAEDKNKISTKFAEVSDIITEANFYAEQDKSKYISDKHVMKAIEEKIYRSSLIAEKIKEYISDGTILIDTSGKIAGQVNGLSVLSLGDFSFGRPSRVTVSIAMGKEGIIDIERETKLGGPIHTKGVLILSGFLFGRFAKDKPLNLSARIVFEQSYGEIEGDSASGAELYALLSAISGVPINQNFAVTGSVNQKGEVQAIGGVNEKIEGFFEICKAKGLTGEQGVIIPKSNVRNLVLKDEVIKAVKEKKFHIYSVRTIDEGIEILTGLRAGKLKTDGTFEKDSINYKVDSKIKEFMEKYKALSGPAAAAAEAKNNNKSKS